MEGKELNGKKVSKKEAREIVYNKLFTVLSEFKPEGKAKKFESNLRKTSKLFATYIIKAGNGKNNTTQKRKQTKEQEPEK